MARQSGFAGSFAVGGENAATVAEVAQEQNVSVEQVNECLNASAAAATAGSATEDAAPSSPTATATTTATASASATALPSTGGPVPSSALALGAGALLVGGGLLARRIAR